RPAPARRRWACVNGAFGVRGGRPEGPTAGRPRERAVKYANIQVLRFFAAFLVLLYHLGVYAQRLLAVNEPAVNVIAHPVFAVGVVVFFAISGFVLTHSLQSTTVPQFLLLRLARIYPAYCVAVAAVL